MRARTGKEHVITGTSPDRIWRDEQQPWLEQAEALADHALACIRAVRPPAPELPDSSPQRWRLEDGVLVVDTDSYHVELDERQGGGPASWCQRKLSCGALDPGPADRR